MPEGIVPELLIALAFLGVIAAAVVARRGKGPGAPTRPEQPPRPRPTETVEEGAPVAEAERVPEVEPPAVPETPPEPRERPGLRARLARSRTYLADRLSTALSGGPGEETWDDVEATLIQADIGVGLAGRIAEDLRTAARAERVRTVADITALLADELNSAFDGDADRGLTFATEGTTVWLVVGVNGTGKTTTIGKLAHDLRARGRSVALAAA
ncbi:MAG TPA: signal recognition particle receptor subunit alpha, partial [Thermoanaerobaculia bacterium]|nr:signal recognition particle receptor subunit alpha [Thermoanaerobaculia bacterium]